jgi:hypothetical protein
MKKKTISCIAVLLVIFSTLTMPATATDEALEPQAESRYVDTSIFAVSLPINSYGKTSPYSCVIAYTSSTKIYMSMALQRYSNGYWSDIRNWSSSGNGELTLSKSYYVTSGYYYRTKATASLYTSSGSFIEQITRYSEAVYY